jgi:hypothetical protein
MRRSLPRNADRAFERLLGLRSGRQSAFGDDPPLAFQHLLQLRRNGSSVRREFGVQVQDAALELGDFFGPDRVLVDQAADFGEASFILGIKALLREGIDKAMCGLGQFFRATDGGLKSLFAGGETDIADADLRAAQRRLRRQGVTEDADLKPADSRRFADIPPAQPLQTHDRADEHDRQAGCNAEFGPDAEVGWFKR